MADRPVTHGSAELKRFGFATLSVSKTDFLRKHGDSAFMLGCNVRWDAKAEFYKAPEPSPEFIPRALPLMTPLRKVAFGFAALAVLLLFWHSFNGTRGGTVVVALLMLIPAWLLWKRGAPQHDAATKKLLASRAELATLRAEYAKKPPIIDPKTDPAHGVDWRPSQKPGMAITIGAARSGKLTSTIAPALMAYTGPVFCLDVKGELSWLTAERRRELGHDVAIIDPFGEVNKVYGSRAGQEETITKYNPLASLDPTSLSFPDEVAALGEAALVDEKDGDNASFFSGGARELFNGLVAAVVQQNPGRASLREVRAFLTMPSDRFAAAVAGICTAFPGTLASAKLDRFQVVNKTNDGIRDTAWEQTKFLDSEELLRSMEPGPDETPFRLDSLARPHVLGSRQTVYVVIPANRIVTHSRWLRIITMQALNAAQRDRYTHSDPILFLLDEAGTALGHLSPVATAYGLSSGLGILIWSFYQNIGQLKHDYPSNWQTFLANSIMTQVVAARDEETCEYFSKYLGNYTERVVSGSETRSSGQSSGNTYGQSSSSSSGENSGTSSGQSESWTSRPLMTPDEIRKMSDPAQGEKELVCISGEGNYLVRRLEYWSDPRFDGMYRPDPIYAQKSGRRPVAIPAAQTA